MDYEKKYNEALSQARFYYENCPTEPEKKKLEKLFPELRESEDERIRQQLLWLCDEWEHNPERGTIPADISNIKQIRRYLEKQKKSLHAQEICKENANSFTSEDERIRKEIIDFLETIPASELKRIPRPISEWFSWLEKQKEQHIPWYDYQKSKEAGYTIVPNEEYEQLIKQKEQKPQVFCEAKAYDLGYKQGKEDAIKEQKPAEWSEEDEDILNCCISSIEEAKENRYAYKETDGDTSYDREIAWLKSLRPQSHWKPSEEQMKVLDEAFMKSDNEKYRQAISSLYYDLQKL